MAELKRSIGLGRGTFMMVNIVLGAGLLTLPGLAAEAAGPSAMIYWLACALAAIPLLGVFAILGSRIPSSGGIPDWAKQAFGRYGYYPCILLFLGAVAVGLPSIAITGGHYIAASIGGEVHLYAVALILAATLINALSPEIAGRISTAVASTLLAALVLMAVIGLLIVTPIETEGALISADGVSMDRFGFVFAMIFFAFTGWEVASNLGGEFRDPRRHFPLAIALSFLVAVGLYLLLAFVVMAAGPRAAVAAPFAILFEEAGGTLAGGAVSAMAAALIFANLSAAIWAVSRLVFAIASEGILPKALAELRSDAPVRAVGATVATLLFVVGLSFAGFLNLKQLLSAAGFNFLLLYAISALVLITLAEGWRDRSLGGLAMVIVSAITLNLPSDSLQYPALLVALGLATAWFKRRRASLPAA